MIPYSLDSYCWYLLNPSQAASDYYYFQLVTGTLVPRVFYNAKYADVWLEDRQLHHNIQAASRSWRVEAESLDEYLSAIDHCLNCHHHYCQAVLNFEVFV